MNPFAHYRAAAASAAGIGARSPFERRTHTFARGRELGFPTLVEYLVPAGCRRHPHRTAIAGTTDVRNQAESAPS